MSSRKRVLFAAWLVMAALHLGVSARYLDTPGLFYDEAIQAGPSLDFLRGQARALHPPGLTATPLLGRPFPWMTQPYMGALKSQLLIPSFALFEASPAVLRITTTLWALAGVLFVMLWADRVLGRSVALASGALLLADPTLLFVTRHDWGSVALALLCRGAGLYFATLGWKTRRPLHLGLAGLAFGLGLYNKVDFAAFLGAAALALVLVRPGGPGPGAAPAGARLGSPGLRRRRGAHHPLDSTADPGDLAGGDARSLRGAAAGGVEHPRRHLFLPPLDLPAVATNASSRSRTSRWACSVSPSWAACRCSRPSPGELPVCLPSPPDAGLRGRRGRAHPARPPGNARRPTRPPHDERLPLPAPPGGLGPGRALDGSGPRGIPGYAVRAGATVVFAVILASSSWMTVRTFELLEASGGRGYWSDALERFAEEVEAPSPKRPW